MHEAKLSVPCHITLNVTERVVSRCNDDSPQHSGVADYLMYPYYLQPTSEATEYSLAMHIFPAYYNNDKRPLEISEIARLNPNGIIDGEKILKNMLRRLDIAIAQRNLLHGDLIIPDLYRQFKEAGRLKSQLKAQGLPDEQSAEAQRKILDITLLLDRQAYTKANPDFRILATNFLLYTLVKDFEENGANYLQYQAVTGFNNLDAWKDLIISPLELVYAATDSEKSMFDVVKLDPTTQKPILNAKTGYEMEKVELTAPKGWSARFNRTFVRMPSLIAFKQKALMIPSDVRYLMRLRADVFEELASYGIADRGFTDEQFNLINNALLMEAVMVRAGNKQIQSQRANQ